MGRLYYLEGDYAYGRLPKILSGWRAEIPIYSVVHGGAIHIIDLLLWLGGGQVDGSLRLWQPHHHRRHRLPPQRPGGWRC